MLAPVLAQEGDGPYEPPPADAPDVSGPAVPSESLAETGTGLSSFDDFRLRTPNEVRAGLPTGGGIAAPADTTDGLRVRLRLEQRVGSAQNLGLEIPKEGRSTLATTAFDLGVESQNELQKLQFVVGGSLRFGDLAPGNNTSTGLTDPRIGLRYSREGANARFDVTGFFRESDIALTGPVWSFLDSEGDIILPRDYSFLQGSGQRQAYALNTTLETGISAPFGVVLNAGVSGVNYENATNTGLSNYRQAYVGVSPKLRINEVTTGVVDFDFTRFSNNSLDRETRSYAVGLDREIDAVSSLNFRFGQTEVETNRSGVVTTSRGPSGSASYTRALSNGQFSARFRQVQNQDGNLATLSFFRSLELPNGRLSGSLGFARQESADVKPIGSLSWIRQGANGSFNLSFNRSVGLASDDQYTLSNAFAAGYSHQINAISSLRVDVGSTFFYGTGGSNDTRRANASIVYSREITDDWLLNAGLTYSLRDEDTVGRADSNGVFFTIGRNFDLRR